MYYTRYWCYLVYSQKPGIKSSTLETCKPRLQESQRLACGCSELRVEVGLRPPLAEARVRPMTPADQAPGIAPLPGESPGPFCFCLPHFPLRFHFRENQEELNVPTSFLQHKSERRKWTLCLAESGLLMLRRDSRTPHKRAALVGQKFMLLRPSCFASCQGEMKIFPGARTLLLNFLLTPISPHPGL